MFDDKELLYEFLINNKESFYKFIYFYVRNKEDTLDIIQDATYKALKSYKSLKERNFMKAWFYKILFNCMIDFVNKNKKYVLDENMDEKSVNNYNINIIDRITLQEAIKKLPNDLQDVIELRFFEDLTYSDISNLIKVPETTIKNKVKNALNKLSKILS